MPRARASAGPRRWWTGWSRAATHPDRALSLTLVSTTAPGRRDLPPPDPAFLARAEAIADLPRGTVEERVEADVQVYAFVHER